MVADDHDDPVTPLPIPANAPGVLLFGGTFDPPHRGHSEPAAAARDAAMPEGSWLVAVPAARSPNKAETPATPPGDRLAMVRLAIAPIPRSAVWTDELDRAARRSDEPSWWVETLRRARAVLPGATVLRFLIGSDQSAAFHRWRDFREVIRLAEPVVVLRDPIADAATLDAALEASGEWSAQERAAWAGSVVDAPRVRASATAIRTAIARAGRKLETMKADPAIAGVLDPAVLNYIAHRGLYRA